LQVEDETRTQERLRRGEVVGAVSIQHQALPSCLVDKLGALDYLFVSSKPFAEKYFPNGVTRSALLKAPVVAFDHLDDMHQAFLQQNFDLPPGSVPCHIVNSSEAFVQLARQGTTCCMIPHLQIEKELEDFTLQMAHHISEKAPLAIAVIKEELRVLGEAHTMNSDEFERIQGMRRAVYDSEDYQEGMNAFLEKRKPNFVGH
jgi:ArgP family transcriptional regulator